MTVLFNKPYWVLCQFSPEGGKKTLADYVKIPDIYPAGRLDFDSEGLVLLTSDGRLQHSLTDPRFRHERTYLVQVEGEIDPAAVSRLEAGIMIAGKLTLPAKGTIIEEPGLPPRDPPVRFRKNIPTSWIQLVLREGRNRQVRRMTAAVGFPTLRLFRSAIGPISTGKLAPGEFRRVKQDELSFLRPS